MSGADLQLQPSKKRSAPGTILTAWLIAGTLDITAAMVNYSLTYSGKLIILFQFIASGALGRKAFQGGIPAAVLGLAFHYFIALVWTIVFFFAYPGIRRISGNRLLTGMIYGIFVWLVMNLVVLRLSRVSRLSFHILQTALGILYLMFCVGLPISIVVGKYYRDVMAEGKITEKS